MIDLTCLGRTPAMRERRYKVLSEYVKGKTPRETAKVLDMPIKQVENDRLKLTSGGIKNIPAEIMRELNGSYYEIKHGELESEAEKYRDEDDRRSYIAIQKEIRSYKADSLKLMGLLSEKVEHSGTIVTIVDDIPRKAEPIDDIPDDDIPSEPVKTDSK